MFECNTCNRTFAGERSCDQHMDALDHWGQPQHECYQCYSRFYTRDDCNEHMDDFDHHPPQYECDHCVERFYTRDDCNEHMDDYGHHRWECETCTRNFTSLRAVEQHMDAVGHWEHYCRPCQRKFANANNLRMHLTSRTHQGTKVPCPFCDRGFASATGVTHHLETGSCPNTVNVDRETIYHAIRNRDRNGIVTNNMIEWHEEKWSPTNAWNGDRYECYLCRREFARMGDLEKHLNSPAHMQKIYHCPNSRRCGVQFNTLAGMFNHLESESCGFIKFGGVQNNVRNILTGSQRQIGFT